VGIDLGCHIQKIVDFSGCGGRVERVSLSSSSNCEKREEEKSGAVAVRKKALKFEIKSRKLNI
jgi:hypothetical protein